MFGGVGGLDAEDGGQLVGVEGIESCCVNVQDVVAVELDEVLDAERCDMKRCAAEKVCNA